MRPGWEKRDYSIPLPLKIENGKVTENQRRTEHGYVHAVFAIRLHCTKTIFAQGPDGLINEYMIISKRRPAWEITHIPTGALLSVEFKTLTKSQEFCEAMLKRGTWRFRKMTSAQVPAFSEAMRHAERAVENQPPQRNRRATAERTQG